MSSETSLIVLTTLTFLSGLVAALGGIVAFRLRKSNKAFTVAYLATALILAVVGLTIFWLNPTGGFWLVPVTVGLGIVGQLALRTSLFRRTAKAVLALACACSGSRRWGLALMSLSPLLLVGGFWQVNAMTGQTPATQFQSGDFSDADLEMDSSLLASTDHGVQVPLFKVRGNQEDSLAIEGNQGLRAENLPLPYRAVRLSPPDCISNCVGWVFADAQRWILCRDVPQILEDNGYRAVQVPGPGDIAIYRDSGGTITHVARVTALLDGKRPLIESKWGYQGAFLHLAEETPYGLNYEYYHSPRSGHMLAVANLHEQAGKSAAEVAP
jgi:hypothetical protein